jgi:hypothetical protein
MFQAGRLAEFNSALLSDKTESIKRGAMEDAFVQHCKRLKLSPKSIAFLMVKETEKAAKILADILNNR